LRYAGKLHGMGDRAGLRDGVEGFKVAKLHWRRFPRLTAVNVRRYRRGHHCPCPALLANMNYLTILIFKNLNNLDWEKSLLSVV
jgi:hypothetical protein